MGGEKSICKRMYRCTKCSKQIKKRDYDQKTIDDKVINDSLKTEHLTEHNCNEVRCVTCHGIYPPNHRCYIQPINPTPVGLDMLGLGEPGTSSRNKKNKKSKKKKGDDTKGREEDPVNFENYKYIFFDFETMVMPDKTHKPILCISQTVCQRCLEGAVRGGKVGDGIDYPFDSCRCGPKPQNTFYGEDCQTKFCEYLFSDSNMQSIVIAHCLGSFDGIFLLDYLLNVKKRKA